MLTVEHTNDLVMDGLRDEISRLKAIIRANPDRLIIFREDGRYLKVFSSDENIVADKPERFIGRSVNDFFPREISRSMTSLILRSTVGEMSGMIEYQLQIQGKMRWFEGKAAPAGLDADGTRIAVFMARDITDRKEAEESLKRALDEKNLLLREMQHRVKNSLLMISSLLSIEEAGLESGEDRKSFERLRDRIESMALLYDMLYRSASVQDIDLSAYLGALLENLEESYLGGDRYKAQLLFELDKSRLDVDRAIPLGMIVCELTTNAIKYAFSGIQSGLISVNLISEKGRLRISIEDNGIGIQSRASEGAAKAPAEGGTGLQLVRLLVEQIGGRIERGAGFGGKGLRYELELDVV